MGADLALFPEMYSNGYNIYGRSVSDWIRAAIPADHAFILAFQALAQKLNMAVGITLLEACQTAPKNTLILFDRFGKQVHCNGHSSAFDGAAYLPGLSGSRDTCIMEADESEGALRECLQAPWQISNSLLKAPFLREDYRE